MAHYATFHETLDSGMPLSTCTVQSPSELILPESGGTNGCTLEKKDFLVGVLLDKTSKEAAG